MYYPYFRGKQYDLITLRDKAGLMADSGFVPILEPVREVLAGLTRTIAAINDVHGKLILIANPINGDHHSNGDAISELIRVDLKDNLNISPGLILTDEMSIEDIEKLCVPYEGRPITFIHSGFTNARALAETIAKNQQTINHVFLEDQCGKLYRKHFDGAFRILIRDGFVRRANRKHPPIEPFSDLHITFPDEGMDGFGDFLIVGNEYSETGGPAYSVAIHLTFIDPENDNAMFVHHFKSDRYDTPTDPAGKFAEAVSKLVAEVNKPGSHIYRSKAVEEFLDLQQRGHFPGLGYVKKLSMNHHIETLANYFQAIK